MQEKDLEKLLNLFNLTTTQAMELLLQILNSDYFMVMVVSFDNSITYLNKGMARLFGKPREAIINHSIYNYFSNSKSLAKVLNETYKNGIGEDQEIFIIKSDGSKQQISLLFFRVSDEVGKFQFFVGVGHEKEQIAGVNDYEASKEFLSLILGSLPEMLFTLDRDLNLQFLNNASLKMLGYETEELVGKNFRELFVDKSAFDEYIGNLKKNPRREMVNIQRVCICRKNQETFMASLSSIQPVEAQKYNIGLIGALRDISSEIAAENSLTERNRQLATLSRISSLVSEGGNLQFLLEKILLIAMQVLELRATAIYRISPNNEKGEMIVHRGVPRSVIDKFMTTRFKQPYIDKLLAIESPIRLLDVQGLSKIVRDALQKNKIDETHIISIKSKDRIHGFLCFVPLRGKLNAEETALIEAIIVQIGVAMENSRLLEQLRHSQAKYSAVVERANDGIMISQDDAFIFVNRKLANMLGYTVSDMIGMPITQTMVPEDQTNLLAQYYKRISGNVPKEIYQSRLMASDGNEIPVEFNAISIDFEGKPASLSFVRDLSERIELQNEIVAQKEMAEFYNDVLTHDVNNMMQTILGNISLLADINQDNLSDEQKKQMDTVRRTAKRCSSLIDQVRELMMIRRLETESFLPISLRMIIGDAAEIVRDQFRDIPFSFALSADENQFVMGNQLVSQLFVNLISNSVRHNSKEKKWVHIDVADEPNDDSWRIVIEDNGDGIDPDAKEKLYKRFARFSKKEGLGLGMSIVKAIVDVMKGQISISDREAGRQNEGTRITVILPKA